MGNGLSWLRRQFGFLIKRRIFRYARIKKKFDNGVEEKIAFYVYRLIDPRNGQTFYVGKGTGNRVFQHVQETLKLSENSEEDNASLKIKRIQDIHQAGLEVIYVIHRHGMDEETAFEVEAALIDAYEGLTNVQGGHGSADYGPMNAQQLNAIYAAQELAKNEMTQPHCVIIKIRQATVDSNDGDIYKTVRYAWKISKERIDELNATPDYLVLAVINGIVKGVYTNAKWKKVTNGDDEGRYEFDADEAKAEVQSRFIGKRINSEYRRPGMANPVILTWK